ncbi:MAG: hypothetical protein NZL95_09940 [Chitinophagales bacterium]|nr:hypothetical protein [Chitinophagales bacterium]MDW8428852.1 hypothetical protein [Chitinophagales bacterium]
MRHILFYGSILLFLNSCTSDVTPEPPQQPCVDSGRVISYSADVVPIINTYCSNPQFGDCHHPGANNPDLTVYDELQRLIEAGIFQDRVFGPFATGQRMPPSFCNGCPTTLERCDEEVLKRWIEQGYLNN